MKKRTDYYSSRLIKENLGYILLLFVFVLLLGFLLPRRIRNAFEHQNKITSLTEEVANFKRQETALNAFDVDQLDQLIQTLNLILPNQEDYFSIFKALNTLSEKTGFKISSYAIDLTGTNSEKISLTVKGEGAPDTFVNFLEKYRFAGGRLITLDNINFSSVQNQNNVNLMTDLTLNFYAKQAIINEQTPLNFDAKLVESAKKITQEGAESAENLLPGESEAPVIFQVKDNPFSD